jgi:ankyrin repeat protein
MKKDFVDDILSSAKPINLNFVDEHGRSALMVCGLDPQLDVARTDSNCAQIGKILHSIGFNISVVDNYGLNSVHLASVRGLSKFISYLCKNGVDCDSLDNNMATPLLKAASHGFIETADVLIRNNANISIIDKNGFSILHYAVGAYLQNSHFREMLLFLLKKVPNDLINVKDYKGRTPLMLATRANDVNTVKELLSNGADPRIEDKDGLTAFYWTHDYDIQQILSEAMADAVLADHAKWVNKRNGKAKEL